MNIAKYLKEPGWKNLLADQFSLPYFKNLNQFLQQELEAGKIIYPPMDNLFLALNLTPFNKVKVVILGQDPYHGPGQAHGLAFSVSKGVKIPPSLKNIYKELQEDLAIKIPEHGYLQNWAHEGVLLLNTVLTVEGSLAGSHQKRGWEKFTDEIIKRVNTEKKNVVFILWGSPAQKKATMIDKKKHKVLTSAHPSPLSSYRGFFGSKPFSQTNDYLQKNKIKPINWSIS